MDEDREPILAVAFYRTDAGNEPVREWLKSLSRENKKIIGEDIMILLHGFVKKSQKISLNDLNTARRRLNDLQKE